MRTIPEKQLSLATLISLGNSSGSGFLLKTKVGAYLITAKHVLFDDLNNLRTDEIELTCPTIEEHDESVLRFRVYLNKSRVEFHKINDVAVVEIGHKEGENKTINYTDGTERLQKGNSKGIILKKEYACLLSEVLISNDIYISGYPTSLGLQSSAQFDYSKPLLRKGILSNIYKSTSTLILDCAVYGGNSGGPVIQIFEIGGKKNYLVIGVVSQFIPFVQKWRNDRDKIVNVEYLNSGYSVATSMDVVLELINRIENP